MKITIRSLFSIIKPESNSKGGFKMSAKLVNSDRRSKDVSGTQEWAAHNLNFINGCKHDCKYCYSKAMAIRFGRKTPKSWKNEVVRENALNRRLRKHNGRIMFPSSHDIHPDHLDEATEFLGNILISKNKVLIVSKPHLICIKRICDEFTNYKKNILFRFTMGSSDSKTLKFWEPGAPDFSERMASLKWAYKRGFQTSVSCEPMLDDNIEDVVEKVGPFVTDSIWIGKANGLLRRLKINGVHDNLTINRANQLIQLQSDSKIKELYEKLKNNQKIKWKGSIKKVVGIKISTEKGLDV